jgi:eukaryotic-like serine/threonine-protein kinase
MGPNSNVYSQHLCVPDTSYRRTDLGPVLVRSPRFTQGDNRGFASTLRTKRHYRRTAVPPYRHTALPPLSSSMPSALLDRLETALAGKYAIIRELGRGGMATVYLADDLKHRRQVAIKVLKPELGSLLGADRFTREIQIAAGLNHPHILPLYESGEAGKRGSGEERLLWFSMPYVRGESLRQRLIRERQLPVDEAIAIVRQVASALDHAHAHGLIHRDIKPENILIHEGEAMVTDFGIALDSGAGALRAAARWDSGERLTQVGVAMGTPVYMSPEQAAGDRTLDARSDVYSLGCVLYELLAGEPPYTGITSQAVLVKRFTDPIPRIRRLRATVPQSVEQAIMKALAVTSADRFATAAQFAEALTKRPEKGDRPTSIAVLPFLNLSLEPENEFFTDGITEDVIAQLSKIRALKVISRASVMPYKKRQQSPREIGIALEVASLLDGSVRRAGNRVRITAQLIDAENERHLWAETYDRELTDIFAIQSDVALQIAAALEAELSPEEQRRIRQEPTQDVQAYQLYLLGKHCLSRWTQEGIDQGLEYLKQAVARDPSYGLAYAEMAHAYLELGIGIAGDVPPEKAFPQAKQAIAKALEADPGLAEAHAMLAFSRFACDYDWAGAEQEFQLALELNPSSGPTYDAYGLMLSAIERYDEALEVQRRAHELDPLSHRLDRATTYLRSGRYDEALDMALQVTQLDPHFAMARSTLGWAYIHKGLPELGIAELERAVSLAPDSTMFLAQLGQGFARTGKLEQAREILRRLKELSEQRYVSPYHLAYVYTGLGEHDLAMDWLECAYNEGAGGIWGIKGSFLFAPLRSHPRFKALLEKINLG